MKDKLIDLSVRPQIVQQYLSELGRKAAHARWDRVSPDERSRLARRTVMYRWHRDEAVKQPRPSA